MHFLCTGIANKILSFKGWVPLSRLTYCAYLLNPLIINSIYLSSENSAHVDSLQNVRSSANPLKTRLKITRYFYVSGSIIFRKSHHDVRLFLRSVSYDWDTEHSSNAINSEWTSEETIKTEGGCWNKTCCKITQTFCTNTFYFIYIWKCTNH